MSEDGHKEITVLCVSGDSGPSVWLVTVPNALAGITITSIGYDDTKGVYLSSENEEYFYLGEDLSAEEYDHIVTAEISSVIEWDQDGNYIRDYYIEPIPRVCEPAFGV